MNGSVTTVDAVTQANAASAEESAAASEELSAQAAVLQDLVKQLQGVVDGQAAGAPRAGRRGGGSGHGFPGDRHGHAAAPAAAPRQFGAVDRDDAAADLLEI